MIRVAIVGSGRIVPQMLEAMQTVPGYDVIAICGRSAEKAGRFGIPHVYTDYAEMLARPDIDFVYVALPNSLHFAAARQALLAGKNVLCEKPFTSTVEQAEELFALAEQRGLWIFEAISNIHLPNFRKVQELLPQIGQLQAATRRYVDGIVVASGSSIVIGRHSPILGELRIHLSVCRPCGGQQHQRHQKCMICGTACDHSK